MNTRELENRRKIAFETFVERVLKTIVFIASVPLAILIIEKVLS